jgi:hypothetical protein
MKMRVAGLALLALLVAAPAMGQMEFQKQIYFGVKGGVNIANLAMDPEPDPSPETRMGIAGGATLAFIISPGMTLDTDFLYMQKGAKWTYDYMTSSDVVELEYEAKYTYLVINPMFRFTVQNEGMRPFFMAGPEIGFLLDAEGETTGGDNGETDTVDLKDETKSTDFGINFGAGLEFPSGNSTFFVEARYALGLANIYDVSDEEETKMNGDTEPDVKHRGIYLMAGIRF